MGNTLKAQHLIDCQQHYYLSRSSPDKQIDLLKALYGKSESVRTFTETREIEHGLFSAEKKLYHKYITKKGSMLVIGCSGGRETIPFARSGFKVTGIDIIGRMIAKARKWAKIYGLKINYKTADISDFNPGKNVFNYILFSVFIAVAGRENRLLVLRKLHRALKKHGLLFVYFHHPDAIGSMLKNRKLENDLKHRMPWYEKNDYYKGFILHQFTLKELTAKAKESGFRMEDHIYYKPEWTSKKYGIAVLRKH